MSDVKPLEELEMFDLLRAAYPEKFRDESDATWDAVMDFVDGYGDDLYTLLARIVLLAPPQVSELSGKAYHALGTFEIADGKAYMTAAVMREVSLPRPKERARRAKTLSATIGTMAADMAGEIQG